MSVPAAVYRPRNSQSSDYYRCVEDYFETFVGLYDEYFSQQFGSWRPYGEQVIYRYLDTTCPIPDTGAICTKALHVSRCEISIASGNPHRNSKLKIIDK